MVSALPAGFGSDSFFREMKQAWQKDDEKASLLLLSQVKSICRSIIRNDSNGFYNVTSDDFEDYVQEGWIRLWQDMARFLSDPMNDPDSEGEHYTAAQKNSLAYQLILYEMKHLRDRKMGKNPIGSGKQRIDILSLDQPAGSDEGDRTLGDFIPSPFYTPEEKTVISSAFGTALEQLFALPNNTETLASVGYVILASVLEKKRSAEEYADFLSRHTVYEILGCMESMLTEYGLDPSYLLPFRRRVEKAGSGNTTPDISAKKLVNRKNDIRSALRNAMAEKNETTLKQK